MVGEAVQTAIAFIDFRYIKIIQHTAKKCNIFAFRKFLLLFKQQFDMQMMIDMKQ